MVRVGSLVEWLPVGKKVIRVGGAEAEGLKCHEKVDGDLCLADEDVFQGAVAVAHLKLNPWYR